MKRTAEIAYTEYWVIRVIRTIDKGITTEKRCIKEIEFPTPPTEQDIVEVLMNCEPNEFISVAHNYKRG